MAKNQTKAKQHSEAEPFFFENYSFSSSTLSSKHNKRYVCLNEVILINENENDAENEK